MAVSVPAEAPPRASPVAGSVAPPAGRRRPAGLFGLVVVVGLVLLPSSRRWWRPTTPPSRTSPTASRARARAISSAPTTSAATSFAAHLRRPRRARRGRSAVLVALVIGLLLGVIAGYLGGQVDNAMIVVMDAIQAFPAVVLALTVLAVLGPSLHERHPRDRDHLLAPVRARGACARARDQAEPVHRGRAVAGARPRRASSPSTCSRTSSRRSSSCWRWTSRARSRSRPASRSSASASSRRRRRGASSSPTASSAPATRPGRSSRPASR